MQEHVQLLFSPMCDVIANLRAGSDSSLPFPLQGFSSKLNGLPAKAQPPKK